MTPNPPPTIRPMLPDDAQALFELYNNRNAHSMRCFRGLGGQTANLDRCEEAVVAAGDAANQINLVAVDADAMLIGWAFIWKLGSDAPMFGLLVADRAQRRGLGRKLSMAVLVDADARRIPEVHLTVVDDNAHAIRLYEQLGFIDTADPMQHDGVNYRRMIRRRR